MKAGRLIEGLDAGHLIADKDYDTDAILELERTRSMNAIIPPKNNRTVQKPYDEDLYTLHHLVKNAFLHLKRWEMSRPATRKNSASFVAASRSGSKSRDYSI
ncbi:MAG: hypothetical protein WAU05_11270 [Nitrospira sp.]